MPLGNEDVFTSISMPSILDVPLEHRLGKGGKNGCFYPSYVSCFAFHELLKSMKETCLWRKPVLEFQLELSMNSSNKNHHDPPDLTAVSSTCCRATSNSLRYFITTRSIRCRSPYGGCEGSFASGGTTPWAW